MIAVSALKRDKMHFRRAWSGIEPEFKACALHPNHQMTSLSSSNYAVSILKWSRVTEVRAFTASYSWAARHFSADTFSCSENPPLNSLMETGRMAPYNEHKSQFLFEQSTYEVSLNTDRTFIVHKQIQWLISKNPLAYRTNQATAITNPVHTIHCVSSS